MLRALPLFLFILFAGFSFGQTKFSGTAVDSLGDGLPNATVSLYNPTDSMVVAYTLTSLDGEFLLESNDSGFYWLQVNLSGFAPYRLEFNLSGKDTLINLGTFSMEEGNMLGTFDVVARHIPIMIKNDTIQYNADAFKTDKNAAVEDLFKKLPGIEVDQDGNIKANGENVTRILVNGEEFFGNDPKLISKNLGAGAVDKVEVFDKKSEKAEFTGVDDGNTEKTINIVTKKGMMDGYFGSITGGYGTDDRFLGKGNLNKFTDKSQFSLIALGNNTNESGFTVDDYINFMGGWSNIGTGAGMQLRYGGANDLFLPVNEGRANGNTNTYSGGLNYSHKFSKKLKISSSYLFYAYDLFQKDSTDRETFIEGGSFQQLSSKETNNDGMSHKANMNIEWKPTKRLWFESNSSFNTGLGNSQSSSFQETYNIEGALQNDANNTQDINRENMGFETQLDIKKRFKKRGRSIYVTGNYQIAQGNDFMNLMNNNNFYLNGGSNFFIMQDQETVNNDGMYKADFSYTEPIKKNYYLELNAEHANYKNEQDFDVYDVENGRIYLDFLSNEYRKDYSYNSAGFNVRYLKGSKNFQVGLKGMESQLNGTTTGNDPINNTYQFLLPYANITFSKSMASRLKLTYTTNVSEPDITQLQPRFNNTDPLNIYEGNPNLDPEYRHNFRLNFHRFKAETFSGTFAFAQFQYTQDKIITARNIDENFITTTRPINVARDYNGTVFGGFTKSIEKLGVRVNGNTSYYYGYGIAYLNNIENTSEVHSNSLNLTVNNLDADVIDIFVGAGWNRTNTLYNINTEFNQSFTTVNAFADLRYRKKRWVLNTGFDYKLYDGQAFLNNTTIYLLTASVSRYFFESENGELKLSAFDLLNQNVGISQNTQGAFVEQQWSNSIGRYFMLSFTYTVKDKKSQGGDPSRGKGMKWRRN